MLLPTNRRIALKTLGLSVGALFVRPLDMHATETNKEIIRFDVGLASYSTRNFSLDETLAMCARMGVKSMTIKSMHLPLDSSDAEIKAAISKVKNTGITPVAGSVIYMKSKKEVDNAFHYTRVTGMPMIVGVPDYELLDYAEEKVKAYDIKLAIHNHGPDDLPYPSPEDILQRIEGRDSRIGVCMDIGHVVRLGNDPVTSIKRVGQKLFDMHAWDVSEASASGIAVPGGLGVIDFPAVIQALIDIKYDNILHVEYASEANDPLPGLAQTIGYLKGCMAIIK